MDPNTNLEDQLFLADKVLRAPQADGELAHDAARLAELVIALNCWISNGGFLPQAWERK